MKKWFFATFILFLAACSPSRATSLPSNPPTDIPFQLPEKWTVTPTSTLTRTTTITLTPTETPIPTNTFERFAGGMIAQPPSDTDLKNQKSIWTLAGFRELIAPGSISYTAQVPHSSVWLWDWSFCTTTEKFSAFLASTDLQFRLEDQPLREEYNLRVYDRPGMKGWICRNWATMLSEWPLDRAVDLEIRYTYRIALNDGKTDYPAGDYSQLIMVVVKG
jgi:hypothetical protein